MPPAYSKRIKWFNEARFGIFIHWGLYSVLGRGEWAMNFEHIPVREYEKLAWEFNPKKFDAEAWVKLAKNAGAKYMVLTTRHHEGFCLWDSKSDFTSVKTAARRDFVAEYVKACRKHGMKIGFYYSLLDWRYPSYHLGRFKMKEDFEDMVQQAHEQVKELMSNYGKIDILWYDGDWVPYADTEKDRAKVWRAKELNKMVRKLQPDILINNRSGTQEDIDTPEQYIQASKPGRAWETCMTMGDYIGWGYLKHNSVYKQTGELIQYLVSAARGGGNYLLNIGPRPDGTVQPEFTSKLKEIGRWLTDNGESIYNSNRTPDDFTGLRIRAGMLGTATVKGNNAFIHIYRWPGKEAVIPGIKNKVLSATILISGKKVEFKQLGDGKVVLSGLPVKPPDKYDTVIKLKLQGKPETFYYMADKKAGIPL